MRIGEREISLRHPALLVAEISGNHNGSLDRAIQLIHAARSAGADAVKFQAFTLPEILALRGTGTAPPPWDSFTLPELYAKVITPHDWFPQLFAETRSLGLIPFASVFGKDSLAMLESLDCPAYKIAKPEARCRELVQMVAATGKPVFISGLVHPAPNAYAIHCPGGYPAKLDALQLEVFGEGSWYFGLSCHCPDPLAGAMAVARGAKYVEYHLTLDDGVPTLDDCVNLGPWRFGQMVGMVRQVEEMV